MRPTSPGRASQNAREETERRKDDDCGESAIQQVVDGNRRPGIDLLADIEGVVRGLSQQHDGEPQVLALGGAKEEEAENGEPDQPEML